MPLSEVGRQLGHARLATAQLYLRLTNSERRAYASRVQR
jgi:hypothetical protein